jgi:hypothetical protein
MPPSPVALGGPMRNARAAPQPADHGFLGAGTAMADRATAGFFLADFGFFTSRLLRFCPLAMSFLLSREHRD